MKISIIGAGSFFTQNLVVDILNVPNLDEGTFALVDIESDRLEKAHKLVEKVISLMGKNWKVISSVNRREVITSSDFVINQIEVNGLHTVKNEFEIPLKYGVKQCIGDTMGPGGLFKTLRTLPAWFDILKDIQELCPNTQILNYTNPMSAITLATTKVTKIPVVGLCHSVQETSQQLADYLNVPIDELKWNSAGINHMSWILELSHKGKDMYPILMEKIKNPEFLAKDPVRFDAMKYLGAFVTESSGHFSEYIPYYRKRQELIDKYCSLGYNGQTGFYANEWPSWRKGTDDKIAKELSGEKEISLLSSKEYASVVIDGIINSTPKVIYGNVINNGLIENLPYDGIVEVACLVNSNGVQPCHFGKIPEHLAALNRSNMSFFQLAVDAVIKKDKQMAMQALMIDPLTSAVCSLEEIKQLFNELYEAEKEYIAELN